MAPRIRVLDAANKTMQRLGYLKLLCVLVNETETSSLASLGERLMDRITKRVRLTFPFDEQIRDYARNRLTDRVYRDLRKTILDGGARAQVSLEIQDLYLADCALPSRTGRLVEGNQRRYPYLGTALELIKKGTYSALTRSLVLLSVTPQEELAAFTELDRHHNPLLISKAQALVLLYCLIDNDGDVASPLFQRLLSLPADSFDERAAVDFLPDILRGIINGAARRTIPIDERNRLAVLSKVAASIDQWRGKAYSGGGAREEAIRVRLEPYCDLGLLVKPDRDRYEYRITQALRILVGDWQNANNTDFLLQERFFSAFAACL